MWGELLCELRGGQVKRDLEELEDLERLATRRAELVPGDSEVRARSEQIQNLRKALSERRIEVESCQVSVADKESRGDDKYWIILALRWVRAEPSSEPLVLSTVEERFGVEVTRIGDAWKVTGESSATPKSDDLHLFPAASRPDW